MFNKTAFSLLRTESQLEDFLSLSSTITHKNIDFEDLDTLVQYNNTLPPFLSSIIKDISDQNISISLFEDSSISSIFVLDSINSHIYMDYFFFESFPNIKIKQLKLYLYFLSSYYYSDISINLKPYKNQFLLYRERTLTCQEIDLLLGKEELHLIALVFLYLLLNLDHLTLSYFENNLLKELYSNPKLKKTLNLKEGAFKYIRSPTLNTPSDLIQEKAHHFHSLLKEKSLDFMSYIQSNLKKKKILLWSWWTVSPFLTKDICQFLSILSEEFNIKKVYLDLPISHESHIRNYTQSSSALSSTKIEKYIKNIYPPFFDEFQKETLPYISTLNKLKTFSINPHCIGISGKDMLSILPFINQNSLLQFPIEKQWKNTLEQEVKNASFSREGDIVLFIQFLKPMYYLPETIDKSHLESLIHVDQYTGLGPYAPCNSLGSFSISSLSKKSLILPNIDLSYLKNEQIAYIPEKQETNNIKIDHSKFNQFSNYNSLLYSYHSNGYNGEAQDHSTVFKKHKFL